ncbi:MAG: DUF433 domain-containing protein [Candidatus Zixiibacteriota bacterium]
MSDVEKGGFMESTIWIRRTGAKVTDVLDLIAKGHSHSQILDKYTDLSMGDILNSAAFARDLILRHVSSDNVIRIDGEIRLTASSGRLVDITEQRKTHPRAYEPWTQDEENRIASLYKNGETFVRIGDKLQRKPGAVRSRLLKLGMIKPSQQVQKTKESLSRIGD